MSSLGFGHHQIIAMNDLIATTVPEDAGDFTTLVAGDASDIGARIGRQTTPRFAAGAGANDHCVAAFEASLDIDHASRQETRAAAQSSSGAVIDNHRTGWIDRTGDPRLACRAGLSARQKQRRSAAGLDCSKRPHRKAATFSLGDQHATACAHRNAGRDELCHHPARAVARRRFPGHRLDLGPDLAHRRDVPGVRVFTRVGSVEPVDVGQQHQQIGARHLRDAGCEPIIVAKADLGSRDRVVLVDNGYRAEGHKLGKGGARIQMPAALLRIVQGQEDLGDGNAVAGERFLIGMGEADLPGGGSGLLFLESEPPTGEPEMPAAYRDRARRYEDYLLATRTAAGNIVGQGVEPWAVNLAAVRGQRGRTDLYDEPPSRYERFPRGGFLTKARPPPDRPRCYRAGSLSVRLRGKRAGMRWLTQRLGHGVWAKVVVTTAASSFCSRVPDIAA